MRRLQAISAAAFPLAARRVPAFADLPDLVLGPLAGRTDGDWHAAPPGKWSSAQIVEHLAISLDLSSRTFLQRLAKGPMRRRRRSPVAWAGYWLLIRGGRYPGGFRAAQGTAPGSRPDPAAAAGRFREGHARFRELEPVLLPARRDNLFVKHPFIGDLTLPEWLRFHALHCAHHARQIRERLAS
jgi:hypothetical protein